MLTIEKDIDKIKEMLEGAGIEVIPTVEVPYFSAGVPCGNPSMIGDETYETVLISEELVKLGCTFVVRAIGNSMIGANIFEGDQLTVRAGANAKSGDIVVVFIGGEATVKVYFKDEKGVSWLLPQNDMYEPIRIDEDMGASISGVVVGIQREHPRVEYNECLRTLRNATKTNIDKPVTKAMILRALKVVMPMIQNNRQWFSIYRVLVDRKFIPDDGYVSFVNLIKNLLKDDAPNLSAEDLRKISVMGFAKPFVMWTPENAPVKDKRFTDYLNIAKAFNRALR